MPANTEKPLFTIRLTGEGLHPHLIPASDLAQLLVAAEQTTATANRLFRSLPARSLEGLRTLTAFSRQRNGRTQFWNGGDRPILDLPPEFGVEVPAPEYQRGETVFHGKIERVGGVRPRVSDLPSATARLATAPHLWGSGCRVVPLFPSVRMPPYPFHPRNPRLNNPSDYARRSGS